MATIVQRKVLWWMMNNGGELYISTGNKTVGYSYTSQFGKEAEMFCRGNVNLQSGLLANDYAVRKFTYSSINQVITPQQRWDLNRFCITEKGRRAAGKCPPADTETLKRSW